MPPKSHREEQTITPRFLIIKKEKSIRLNVYRKERIARLGRKADIQRNAYQYPCFSFVEEEEIPSS